MRIKLKTNLEKGRSAEVTLDDGTKVLPKSFLAFWENGTLRAHVTTDGRDVSENVEIDIPDDEDCRDVDLVNMRIREGAFYSRLIRLRKHFYQEIDRTRKSNDFEAGDRLFHGTDLESLLSDILWFEDNVRSMAQFQKELDIRETKMTKAQKDFTKVLNVATGASKTKEDSTVEDHINTFISNNLHGKIARETKRGARKLRKITPADVFGQKAKPVNR